MPTNRLILALAGLICATAIIITVLILRDEDPPYLDPETGCPPPALLCDENTG